MRVINLNGLTLTGCYTPGAILVANTRQGRNRMKKVLIAVTVMALFSTPVFASEATQQDKDTLNKICSLDVPTVEANGDRCSFDSQCGFNYTCVKHAITDTYGVCVKN